MQREKFGRVINRSDEWDCYCKKDRLVEKWNEAVQDSIKEIKKKIIENNSKRKSQYTFKQLLT